MNVEAAKDLIRSRHVLSPRTGCWNWSGAKSRGYGYVWFEGKQIQAHRLALAAYKGVERHEHTHHTCENRQCVNPNHLVAASTVEHKREHLLTHCRNGHPLVGWNRVGGKNRCRQCWYDRRNLRRRFARIKADGSP